MCNAWLTENVKYEIARLQAIVRDRTSSDVERAIASVQLYEYSDGVDSYLDRLYGGKN
jgi:hypothetical protein